jgi:tRNA(Arg) A34 adenosine deaminase TadA
MYLKLAIREATKARHKQHNHGAVLIRGGKPVAVGHNHSHIHAEHAALNRAWRHGTEGGTLVVIRVRKDGTIGMSRPCEMCVNRLISAGIKKVIYSDSDGSLKSFKLPTKSEVSKLNITLQNILWYKKEA